MATETPVGVRSGDVVEQPEQPEGSGDEQHEPPRAGEAGAVAHTERGGHRPPALHQQHRKGHDDARRGGQGPASVVGAGQRRRVEQRGQGDPRQPGGEVAHEEPAEQGLHRAQAPAAGAGTTGRGGRAGPRTGWTPRKGAPTARDERGVPWPRAARARNGPTNTSTTAVTMTPESLTTKPSRPAARAAASPMRRGEPGGSSVGGTAPGQHEQPERGDDRHQPAPHRGPEDPEAGLRLAGDGGDQAALAVVDRLRRQASQVAAGVGRAHQVDDGGQADHDHGRRRPRGPPTATTAAGRRRRPSPE